jgi:hypothetical protein
MSDGRGVDWRQAFVSGGFALVGAAIGVGGGVWIANVQATNQAKLAQQQTLQNQRQVAYAKMLTDEARLEAYEVEMIIHVSEGVDVQSEKKGLIADFDTLTESTNVAQLVASHAVRKTLGPLITAQEDIFFTLQATPETMKNGVE